MANYTANPVTDHLLEIPAAHKELLGQIRHWDNLKAAFDERSLWVKDITPEQAESAIIKGLPYSRVYYAKDGLLFLKGSLLPVRKMPHNLLWSPLTYALPVKLPLFNHNYFGISQKIGIRIVPSQKEQPVYAVLAERTAAGDYINTAPKVRLAGLQWVGVNDEVLIAGTPLLPVAGASYWMYNDFLLPAGFDFELPLLAKKLMQQIDPGNSMMILWHKDNSYIPIEKEAFMPLSISSFRLTYTIGQNGY
ncbi:hypothetical protein HYN59_16530 [Flavobacterium album]|uniref:MoxR-vWA-beta-propeller ternary system domain-containing protein n=1 Tax=Flavobacterium album TaxID=2175091 RepID=A0A2S1R204_9FLAO|nr:hypothetical protein [Flavobacterium album]AWH86616.1 hypothetical protein HYN59_16530 [Flavobacterium album]